MGRAYANTNVDANGNPLGDPVYEWVETNFDGTWAGPGDTSNTPFDWSGWLSNLVSGGSGGTASGTVSPLVTAGLGALLNSMGGGQGAYAGYKGGIPRYVAKRDQLPIPKETIVTPAVAATATEAGKPAVTAPRRPGSGGITYFSPMSYSPYVTPASGGSPVVGDPTTTVPTPTTNDQGYTTFNPAVYVAKGGAIKGMASGGISSLGGYSDGGQLLRGPGDGVSDSIPATIGGKQKAALADGEFVIPARIVSELGNGSTEAGARKLYAMMDRVQRARKKSLKNVAANSKADKYLPK